MDAASLTDPSYIYAIREQLGVRCPSCSLPTIEPTNTEHDESQVAPHVSCGECDWQGTAGDVERQQLRHFTKYDDKTVYALWQAFGSITEFAGASRGVLKRECREIDTINNPVDAREEVATRLPEALRPIPPDITERFSVDEKAVKHGVELTESLTPYDAATVESFVAESYAAQMLQPSDKEVALAQTGNGRIQGAFARRPLTSTDEDRIEKGYQEIREAVETYSRRTQFATQREAVIAIRTGFEPALQRRLRSDIVADVVGCNESYAAEFELVTTQPFPIVLKKEHVARREMNALTESMRETVKERDDYNCVRCAEGAELEVHHIVPIAQGGVTNLSNLATLCENCHEAAHGGSYGSTVTYESQDTFWDWIGQD